MGDYYQGNHTNNKRRWDRGSLSEEFRACSNVDAEVGFWGMFSSPRQNCDLEHAWDNRKQISRDFSKLYKSMRTQSGKHLQEKDVRELATLAERQEAVYQQARGEFIEALAKEMESEDYKKSPYYAFKQASDSVIYGTPNPEGLKGYLQKGGKITTLKMNSDSHQRYMLGYLCKKLDINFRALELFEELLENPEAVGLKTNAGIDPTTLFTDWQNHRQNMELLATGENQGAVFRPLG